MMYVLIALLSFCINLFYALYVKNLISGKIIFAAIFGECVVLFGAIATINYVENHYYLIPLVIGGFLGTIASAKR